MSQSKKDFLLTKIIATLGPASADPATIEKLILEGVRVFRINFSHGSFDDYEQLLKWVRTASEKLNVSIGVLGDLSGPKIRVGQVVKGGVKLRVGHTVEFQKEPVLTAAPADESACIVFSTSYPGFIEEVQVGENILLDDGYVRLKCREKRENRLICQVEQGGTIFSNKGVNLPDTELSVPALTEKDRLCVEFAVKHHFDFLALSFVRHGEDVRQLKDMLRRLGARPTEGMPVSESDVSFSAVEVESESIIPVISKIEKPQAVENLKDVLRESDGIMVARGDLGVEMDLATVAVTQKRIIHLCREYGMPCIVATQMLQSMIDSPTPTRAEVSDVANAIFDGADAVMLSGETAVGRYPIESARMMNRIAGRTNDYLKTQPFLSPPLERVADSYRRAAAIAASVRTIVEDLEIKYIIVWSQLGGAAVYLSQQRMPRPILFFTPSPAILQRASLLYALTPIYMERQTSNTGFFQTVDRLILDNEWAHKGDAVVFVLAEPITRIGVANEIVIHYLGDSI
ncbi:pyruvate kinase [candidate division KSB1 bacterium]|nr:pyruvate kinase [candidate division KSB1 bacterium]RQW04296.1 MAG: pyruvate kinase [candidate division KSB1 bacterium]